MEIKKLNPDEIAEFKNLITIFNEVFENTAEIPNDQHLHTLLLNPDFMVFTVRVNEMIVGGLTIYVLHRYYGIRPVAYIYDVAVTADYQGKGFGKALMAEVCNFCKASGFEEVYVEAESNDIDAVNFYRKTPFSNKMNAQHFTYSFTDGAA